VAIARHERGLGDLEAHGAAVAAAGERKLWLGHAPSLTTLAGASAPMISGEDGSLGDVITEFEAQLCKGDNPGAWTCVVMDDVAELFGTRGLVKIRGAIDSQPFDGALMAQGDGTHRLPVRATLRQAIGKQAGDTVHVRIDERIG
jgi:hypothetical protein